MRRSGFEGRTDPTALAVQALKAAPQGQACALDTEVYQKRSVRMTERSP